MTYLTSPLSHEPATEFWLSVERTESTIDSFSWVKASALSGVQNKQATARDLKVWTYPATDHGSHQKLQRRMSTSERPVVASHYVETRDVPQCQSF